MLNTALTFSPDGALIDDYQKHHFVRGFEDGYASGTAIGVVDAPWGTTGVAICKDLDFPTARAQVRRGRSPAVAGAGVGLGRAERGAARAYGDGARSREWIRDRARGQGRFRFSALSVRTSARVECDI